MSTFGWCMTGEHKDCRVKYQRFIIGPVGKGRRKRDGVVWLDQWRECDCRCHRPAETKAKKTPTRRRKK